MAFVNLLHTKPSADERNKYNRNTDTNTAFINSLRHKLHFKRNFD